MGLLIGALADIAVPRAFYLMGGLVLLGALLLRAMPPTVASTAERRT
jgi:hypothetical protein